MKFVINSIQIEIVLKNQAQTNAICDLYECIPRNDTADSVSTMFAQGLIDQNSTSTDLAYGVTPFQSNALCSLYKILKKTRYLLAPGATEIIEYRDTTPKNIDWERITQFGSSASQVYRGISKSWLLVVRGEPTNDSTNKTTQFSTSNAKVDYVTSEIYTYQYAINNAVQTKYTNNYNALSNAPDVLLESTGAVINNPGLA